ncbi:MAG: tRNA (N6-threonylcarbamoyladenosine(37)-N6)-methyltransferase TrmO [Gemmatimonadota bacterium]|jgi:tRNA-Thr(GGU) m(6)t(6)A37 methyltransferase TsaA
MSGSVDLPQDTPRLRPIGIIRSELKERKGAPRRGDEGAPDAWIEIEPWARDALVGIAEGDGVIVLTWLHEARRDTLQVYPRGERANELHGVFSTRSPDRPNPVGLHPVTVLAMEEGRIRVGPIEAIDGTPVIDIKPDRC